MFPFANKKGAETITVLSCERLWWAVDKLSFMKENWPSFAQIEKGDFKIKCGDQWMDIVCDKTKVWNTPNKNTAHK